ncbi:hypothetical protein [Dermacoccus nishinomiyaensis]|uniref:hypothetical protein n=1 Tax=Dermacoccus nishinomiyaensis TaxID=1274 RepID=UPI001F512024|nr:hypothetical protein [Dermacoccus nishinomiyaensis]MCI0153156.1 hypothetical protein [Dermacoccus nishinomiyaensis]
MKNGELVVLRCADVARHRLLVARQTPRGVEVQVATNLRPSTGRDLQRIARRFLSWRGRAGSLHPREGSEEKGGHWSTEPLDAFLTRHVVGPVCRCQSLIEVVPARDVAPLLEVARRSGRTQVARVPFV